MPDKSFKQWLYEQMAPSARQEDGLSPLNKLIATIIVLGVMVVVLETEPTLYHPYKRVFQIVDPILAGLFSVEYLARIWAMGAKPQYKGFQGRLRYMVTPVALLDLLAILPFFITMVSDDCFLLRLARLMRILVMAKLGRYSRALQEFAQVINSRKEELVLSMVLVGVVILLASGVLYLVEGSDQPEAFGSIPRALWWGVITITTIGYGDVYPHSPLGKFCCALAALAGIGLIAIPTGILAAAFSEVFMAAGRRGDNSKTK